MVNNEMNQKADEYFSHTMGVDLQTLLAPIEEAQPAGRYLRSNGVYSAIKEARREDDASLPMGDWEYELKRADWDKVTEVAVHALANKTKDMQLVAWLMEARLHKEGFAGIFACLTLMENLCRNYWDQLYPPLEEEGDLDYRLNILHWMNDKLQPLIKQIPMTGPVKESAGLHWADWESAKRNEQLKQNHNVIAPEEIEGIDMATFMSAMAATSTEQHRDLYIEIDNALLAMDSLCYTLDEFCGDQAPGLTGLGSLLEQIQALVSSELYKRGVRMSDIRQAAAGDEAGEGGSAEAAGDEQNQGGGQGSGGSGGGPITGRAEAYAQLAAAADYLMHLEPHSPAPYLVKRAIEWGNLNTSELYHELFVQYQGQISIFDLLGIELAEQGRE